MKVDIVALGAWCDLAPPAESSTSRGGISFDADEFAMLTDGRRLSLHTGRGFTLFVRASFSTSEEPYDWLSELLGRQDVDVSVDQLRSAPYRIELSDRLERCLSTEHGTGEG